MRAIRDDFFTSGWNFSDLELKNKFQMMNIALVLSSIAVSYGVIVNFFIKNNHALGSFEFFLLCVNIFLVFLLRRDQKYYNLVATIVTAQFSVLLITLLYVSSPEQMKHVWFFTYPIVMLYTKEIKVFFLWFFALNFMMLSAPFQPFVEIQYTFFQLFYLSFVLIIVSVIVYFYKKRMEEARSTIISQQNILKQQINELRKKDQLLTIQSKQAVMGEMISMIAHQWRQPLSTVTLNISNLQVKKLLGEDIQEEELERSLENINETVVYLSETIDDFQTYFRPDKELLTVDINELIEKTISFVKPRLKRTEIEIKFLKQQRLIVKTYANEVVQVLLNIINNAIDELISLKRKYPQVTINVFNREKEVAISIADNAGGIPLENLETIFEPYFSTKGKNGTGLGLYMSQMIMQKQFHTDINVKSSHYGSVFTIVVPKKLA